MSERKEAWTPGEWRASRIPGFRWLIVADGENVAGTASNGFGPNDDAREEANAHLIAAAPDLAAVAAMVDAWGRGLRHETPHESKMVKAARAALAKARGETP